MEDCFNAMISFVFFWMWTWREVGKGGGLEQFEDAHDRERDCAEKPAEEAEGAEETDVCIIGEHMERSGAEEDHGEDIDPFGADAEEEGEEGEDREEGEVLHGVGEGFCDDRRRADHGVCRS